MKKKLAGVLILLELGIVGYWLASGAHVWTTTEVPVQVEDELFGSTTTEWKKEFHPGLEYVGPLSLGLLVGATLLVWRARKEEEKEGQVTTA